MRAAGPCSGSAPSGRRLSPWAVGPKNCSRGMFLANLGTRGARGPAVGHPQRGRVPKNFISLFPSRVKHILNFPLKKLLTNSTNFLLLLLWKSFIYFFLYFWVFFFFFNVPVRRFGAGGGGWERDFFPLLEPFCAFDPWHLPAKGEGRASPALPSNGSCKKQPKRASSALGNLWAAANFSEELDRFAQPETLTQRAGQGAAGSLGAPLHTVW